MITALYCIAMQGIIDSTGMKTGQFFSHMPVKTKFFKELFTPI